MLGQLNLWGKNKVEVAIDRLQSFEPKEGYYLAFSGGKDSQCIYHLAKQAGVKFDAHYRVTSVDPPELVTFIKKQYPDVEMEFPRDKDGKVVTMWNLIPGKQFPPTRIARYCCEKLKEGGGEGRLAVTGVRWAESPNRQANQGEITIVKTGKAKEVREHPDFINNPKGGVVMMNDNAESRRLMEQCVIKGKVNLNPIIDWEDDDVWEYLNDWAKVPHCSLYDEGYTRLGCIGCPMHHGYGQKEDFARWPKYREQYVKAFERMIEQHGEKWYREEYEGKSLHERAELVYSWWVEDIKRY